MRQNASGIYSFLPFGLKVLHKVERIVREEMERAGRRIINASDASCRIMARVRSLVFLRI